LTGEFGDSPVPVVFSAGSGATAEAVVRSWSPSLVVVSVPAISHGAWTVAVPRGCELMYPPRFQVSPAPRIYINNNANNADGFDTITTLAYDPDTGAVTPMGPPTSIGLPASRRPGCRDSLMIAGGPQRLYASGDTGVAVFDIDLDTGALHPSGNGAPYLSGSTGGAALHYSAGAYVWLASDAGVVAWRVGVSNILVDRTTVSPSPASAMAFFGLLPTRVYTTRGDGRFDGWSVAYQTGANNTRMPVLAALDGSPYGTPQASASASAIVYSFRTGLDDALYVPTGAGLGLWDVAPGSHAATEVAGSPFSLNPPSGSLGRPLIYSAPRSRPMYMAASGSELIVGATLDAAGVPSASPGSPWSFAPDLTNVSCLTGAAGATPSSPQRLIAIDAGNRRINVFDVPVRGEKPIPVPGSPFTMTDTPSELASGIAVLGDL